MVSKQKKVASIILNYNKSGETVNLYRQLEKQTYLCHEIRVVDNCSDAAEQEKLRTYLPEDKIIRSEINGGFSYGMNLGIKKCLAGYQFDYVWVLNNDIEIRDRDALSKMIELFEADQKVGVLSPLILDPETNQINFCGGYLDKNGWSHRTNDPDEYASWQETFPDRIWLAGTALLIKREVFDLIGFFEEKYFMYWEDNDFCFRANEAGFVCRIALDAEIYHGDLPWEGRPSYYHYYMARNEILFMRDLIHAPYKTILWAIENRMHNNIRVLSQHGRQESVDATYRGIWDGLLGKTGKAEDFSAPPRGVKTLGRLLSWYGSRQRARGRE